MINKHTILERLNTAAKATNSHSLLHSFDHTDRAPIQVNKSFQTKNTLYASRYHKRLSNWLDEHVADERNVDKNVREMLKGSYVSMNSNIYKFRDSQEQFTTQESPIKRAESVNNDALGVSAACVFRPSTGPMR